MSIVCYTTLVTSFFDWMCKELLCRLRKRHYVVLCMTERRGPIMLVIWEREGVLIKHAANIIHSYFSWWFSDQICVDQVHSAWICEKEKERKRNSIIWRVETTILKYARSRKNSIRKTNSFRVGVQVSWTREERPESYCY